MSLTVSEGGTFTLAPAGTHVAICIGCVDLGTQPTSFKDAAGNPKTAKKVRIMWELCDERRTDNGQLLTTGASYTAGLNEKASLRKQLESWRGRPFTQAELEKFDLVNIVGKPCQLTIIHEPKPAGGTRDKISGITPLHKSMMAPKQVNPSVIFDIDKWDDAVYAKLPAFLQGWIALSPEARAKRPNLVHPGGSAGGGTATGGNAHGQQAQYGPGSHEPASNEIPF